MNNLNKYKNITASGVITNNKGILSSVTVNSHTGGTLAIIDGTEASTAATTTLTSTGACVPAQHGFNVLTQTGNAAGTHAATVLTVSGAVNFIDDAKASAYITNSVGQPTAGKVVVLGNVTYTFVALGGTAVNTATACNVPLGNNRTETMDNLYNAFLTNPLVNTVRTSAYVITVTAKTAGTAGNSIAATEDDSNLDWDGSNTTLTGGLSASTVTINGVVYTFRNEVYNRTSTATAIPVKIAATSALSLVNLKYAINGTAAYVGSACGIATTANTSVAATASDATTLTITARIPGVTPNSYATTETCASAAWAGATMNSGTAGVATTTATITIGTSVYTFVTALSENIGTGTSAIANQVLYGGSVTAGLLNLKKAINGTGIAGTNYSTGTTAHPYVYASASDATTLSVYSRTVGDAAYTTLVNALSFAENMANTAWASVDFGTGTGAATPLTTSDDALIVIGDRTYTAVIELSETSGAAAVADQILWVTTEAVFLDNIKKAINETGVAGTDYSTGTHAHNQVTATTNANDSQVFVSKLLGTVGNAYATSTTLANYAFTSTVMASGTGATGSIIFNTITLPATATLTDINRTIALGNVAFENGLFASCGGTVDLTISYR
jgi:hypothetical protein